MNNVLTPERIIKHTPATAAILSSAAPGSTTADLASKVPKETTGSVDLPGAFPETPATEPAAFSVNPIPETAGPGNPVKLAPGEPVPDPSTLTSNTVTSTAHNDASLEKASEPTFGVAPIPATAGAGNPVALAPGEKVPDPSTLTGNTVNSTVRTDKESYENSGAFGNAPVLPPVVTPQNERDQKGTGVLDMPPITKNMIPESSLPMGGVDPTISSVGPQSTTAALAAAVPLEAKKESQVPEVVKESQEAAGIPAEASAVPEEVKEKSEVESELLKQVPEAPVTSDGVKSEKTITAGETAAAVAGAATALGGAAVAYAATAKDKTVAAVANSGATAYLPESIQQSINSINAASSQKTTDATPEVVKESIAAAGQSPEAAAYAEPVAEKEAVERELLKEVKPETSSGEPAPAIAESGLSAPPSDSRDISPRTVPGTHTQTVPTVTSGVATGTTEAKTEAKSPPTTPAKTENKAAAPSSSSKAATTPASTSSAAADKADKKKKRTSIFGKLKAKFSDKKE